MFKYLLGIAVCLICLVLLQQGCQGFGERFKKRMDERRQERHERWQQWRDDRFEKAPDDGERKRFFRKRWQRNRESEDSDEEPADPILIEE